MPEDVPIDYKLFTVSTVVVQNLNIDVCTPELADLCKLPQVHLENLNVAQDLNIDAPTPESPELADLCKLPKVHLENLNLGMAPQAIARPKLPRVLVEKLDLDVALLQNSPAASVSPRQNPGTDKLTARQTVRAANLPRPSSRASTHTQDSDEGSLYENFSKIPVVLVRRCVTTSAPVRKKVSFNLPIPDKKPVSPSKQIRQPGKTYKIVGPYKGVQIKKCHVRVQRDDLSKLKVTWTQQLKSPTCCKLCGKVYLSKKKLAYHQERKHYLVSSVAPAERKRQVSFSTNVTVHTVPYHRCRKCLKVFKTYKILSQHMKSEHKKRTCYVCDHCTKPFADRTIFKVHIKLHCYKCSRLFLEKRELTQHRKAVCFMRKIRKVKCASCDNIFYSTLALQDHSYSHMEERKLICDLCKEHFLTACSLIRHIVCSHNKNDDITTSEMYTVVKTGSLKVYTCKWCAETFIDESDIVKHVRSDETSPSGDFEKKYGDHKCEYCPKKFKIEKNLIQHMWSHLRNTVAVTEREANRATEKARAKKDVADKTGKEFETVAKEDDSKIEHKQSKREEETRTNDVVVNGAQYSIVTMSSLIPQKKKKKREVPAVCPKCDKTFTRKHGLKRHMNTIHEDLELMRCLHCGEAFPWPSLLRAHRCVHVGTPHASRAPPAFPEVPVVQPESYNCFGLDDELPANGDVTTEIDFDIPAPRFEFAGIPDPFPRDVYQLSPAPTTRGYKYKVVRQEVPIEF